MLSLVVYFFLCVVIIVSRVRIFVLVFLALIFFLTPAFVASIHFGSLLVLAYLDFLLTLLLN